MISAGIGFARVALFVAGLVVTLFTARVLLRRPLSELHRPLMALALVQGGVCILLMSVDYVAHRAIETPSQVPMGFVLAISTVSMWAAVALASALTRRHRDSAAD